MLTSRERRSWHRESVTYLINWRVEGLKTGDPISCRFLIVPPPAPHRIELYRSGFWRALDFYHVILSLGCSRRHPETLKRNCSRIFEKSIDLGWRVTNRVESIFQKFEEKTNEISKFWCHKFWIFQNLLIFPPPNRALAVRVSTSLGFLSRYSLIGML